MLNVHINTSENSQEFIENNIQYIVDSLVKTVYVGGSVD
jgi:hypothetical protein